jgi:hypothetical protein
MGILDFQNTLRRDGIGAIDIDRFGEDVMWLASRGRRPPDTYAEWLDCFRAWMAVVGTGRAKAH